MLAEYGPTNLRALRPLAEHALFLTQREDDEHAVSYAELGPCRSKQNETRPAAVAILEALAAYTEEWPPRGTFRRTWRKWLHLM